MFLPFITGETGKYKFDTVRTFTYFRHIVLIISPHFFDSVFCFYLLIDFLDSKLYDQVAPPLFENDISFHS